MVGRGKIRFFTKDKLVRLGFGNSDRGKAPSRPRGRPRLDYGFFEFGSKSENREGLTSCAGDGGCR